MARDFVPCDRCKGFFVKSSIRVHFKECTGISSRKTRFVMVQGRKIAVVKEKLFHPLRKHKKIEYR